MSNPVIKILPQNNKGRDFVVGDIHGHFETLDQALKSINFDPTQDRIISVGDMIDRGPQSPRVFSFLKQDWFHAVRGNHEQSHIEFIPILFDEDGEGKNHIKSLYSEGSYREWANFHFQDIIQHFFSLPYVIEIETENGNVGIVHAETPIGLDWSTYTAALIQSVNHKETSFILDTDDELRAPHRNVKARTLWGGSRLMQYEDDYAHADHIVNGMTRIFMGHHTVSRRLKMGNNFFIDTGRCYRGKQGFGMGDTQYGHLSLIDIRASEQDILEHQHEEKHFRVIEYKP